MSDILELPFDQYQRYELVHALLESVRGEGETFHVLDVGGRTELLRAFLPDDRVDLVDVVASDAAGLVLGSGAQLPFRDDAFDVVCGFDTLEHVPPALREAFVAECARVARRHVILAGPYDAPRVAEAEQILLDFLEERLDWEHRYLAEHRKNGLPDMDETRRGLEAAGATVEAFGHGALDRWLLLMSLELYIEHETLLREFAKRIYRFYNEHLFRTDHGAEVYRHAVVAAFDGAPMPTLQDALDPAGAAPVEATRTLVEMGREILRYDALRDTYSPEMERLHSVVRDVTKDLDEHKKTLSTVEHDLGEHRATIDALRAEIDAERAATHEMAAARDEHIGGLTADLEGHRATVAELERLRADELKELELRAEHLESANRQLNEKNDEIAETRALAAAALDGEEPEPGSLREAVARLVEARAAALAERDDERRENAELSRTSAELSRKGDELREKNAELYRESQRLWPRIGRALTFRRLDPRLLDD